jgi:hypothetical protein
VLRKYLTLLPHFAETVRESFKHQFKTHLVARSGGSGCDADHAERQSQTRNDLIMWKRAARHTAPFEPNAR